MIIFSLIFILLGLWILHLLSSKQIAKTKQSSLHILTQFPLISRCVAYLLFFSAAVVLIVHYGISIGLISWWIFASPVAFILIMYINDLKNKPTKN
ncbi:DUF1634 domain-containing protein [Acinetobacter sp. ANC 4178]|nr:DUF1634 domain-containing protein [Acinetobacter sp. ANC 4178]